MSSKIKFGSRLQSLSVAFRVNILAAIAIFATVILTATYFVGDRLISKTLNKQTQFNQLSLLTKEMESGALQMRRREKDFLLRQDLKYAAKYDDAITKIEHSLSKMTKLAVAGPVSKHVKDLTAKIDLSHKQFQKIVSIFQKMGLSEETGLRGALGKAVKGVEKKLGTADYDMLTVKILTMRGHEKDFMLSNSDKSIGLIEELRSDFDSMLLYTTLEDADKEEISKLMDAYQAGFATYAKVAITLNAETAKLNTLFEEMAPGFKAISQNASEGNQQAEARLLATTSMTEKVFLGTALIILLAAVGIGMLIGKSITTPIAQLTDAMKNLAEGNTAIDIPNANTKNEMGQMADAVQVFKDNAIERTSLMSQTEAEQQARADTQNRVNELIADFRNTIQSLLETVSTNTDEMETTARSLSEIATQTTSKAANVADMSEDTSNNVQSVAAAAEELSASISEISRQINQTEEVVGQASVATTETDAKIVNLADAAEKIGEVITLIQGIAEQTNLLALNATIEAARAGEAGKGFAVVASEVKDLATQTANATKAISEQITNIQKETESSVVSIRGIADTMAEVSAATHAITASMQEQGAATAEISENVQRAAAGASGVLQNITGVTQAADESQQSANQVLESARSISENGDELRTVINRFLEKVAAA